MTQVNPDVNYARIYTEVQEKKISLKQFQYPHLMGKVQKWNRIQKFWIEAKSNYFATAEEVREIIKEEGLSMLKD